MNFKPLFITFCILLFIQLSFEKSPSPLPSTYQSQQGDNPPASVSFDLSPSYTTNTGGFVETPEEQLIDTIAKYLSVDKNQVLITRYSYDSMTATVCDGNIVRLINGVNKQDKFFEDTLLWKGVNTGVLWNVPCRAIESYTYHVSFDTEITTPNVSQSASTLHIYLNAFDSSDSPSFHYLITFALIVLSVLFFI